MYFKKWKPDSQLNLAIIDTVGQGFCRMPHDILLFWIIKNGRALNIMYMLNRSKEHLLKNNFDVPPPLGIFGF